MPTTREDVLSWRGQNAVDSDGDKIGKIEEIYLDAETNEPEWALVSTGLFGGKHSFVPVRDAESTGGDVRVGFDKDTVKNAPNLDPDGRLSPEEESELYRYYGREYQSYSGGDTGVLDDATTGTTGTTAGTTTGTGTGTTGDRGDRGDVSGPDTDHAMTRSEEELNVGTREREAGRVRLKKYVVEDEVTQTVPVRREEVRIEREPITDANRDAALDGPAISEEEHEVTLHAEEPVVEKRAVPQERVRLDKDVHTEEREVSDTVRKERIDVDDSNRS